MFCIDDAKVHLRAVLQLGCENSHVLTRLGPRIILKSFLNLSDFEPQYSYKLQSYKRDCTECNVLRRSYDKLKE